MNRIELCMVAIGEIMENMLAHPETSISCPKIEKEMGHSKRGWYRIKVDVGFLEYPHIGTMVMQNFNSSGFSEHYQGFNQPTLNAYIHWKSKFVSTICSDEISYVLRLPSDIYNLTDPLYRQIFDAATLITVMVEHKYRRYTGKAR